jgi:hypothetical protein
VSDNGDLLTLIDECLVAIRTVRRDYALANRAQDIHATAIARLEVLVEDNEDLLEKFNELAEACAIYNASVMRCLRLFDRILGNVVKDIRENNAHQNDDEEWKRGGQ